MKLVVVGGVAGGASAAARVRRLDAHARIVVLERGEHVSFSNCSLPYHLGGVVPNSDSLVLMTPEKFKRQHDIEVRVRSEAIAIDREAKTVRVRDLTTGGEYDEPYDKLVLSPGAAPIVPPIPGADADNVFTVRNVTDIRALKSYVDRDDVRSVCVVGGGFVGIEVAENLVRAGKRVAVVEGRDQILQPFDYDMVQTLHKELDDNGVELRVSTTVTSIEKGLVRATGPAGEVEVAADAVVMAVGVAPETKLAADAGLAIGQTRGIEVDANWRTSDPDIYAVGDAVQTYDALAHRPSRLALAGPAQREARAAADHMYGMADRNRGFIGSSCIQVFSQNAACMGLSERAAREAGYECDSVLVYPSDKVGLMPDSNYLGFKLVYEVPTGKLLGAQAIGVGNAVQRVDVVAALLGMGGTLEDLRDCELCYSPVYGTAKDVVNFAAMVALNIVGGRFRQVHVDEVRGLVEKGAYIVDVREPDEYAAGHLNGAHNVPLSQLAERMGEIPRDVPVYLHCRSSQRSYYAVCRLQGMGWRNVTNISGSYLGISLYEYFNDKAMGREPIMDAYNFD